MKKIFAWVLLVGCLALAACGGQPAKAQEPKPAEQGDYSTILTPEPPPEATPEPAASYEIIRTAAVTWTNSIGTPWVQVIIEVENTGTIPLYLGVSSADLETEDGSLFAVVKSVGGRPQILLPGERGAYCEETTLDKQPDGDLRVEPYLEIQEATVPVLRVPTSGLSVEADQYGRLKVMGRVENTESEAVESLSVAVLLYDSEGACIGYVTANFTKGIPAGEKRGFEATNIMLPETVTPDVVADIVAFAYPYQYQW